MNARGLGMESIFYILERGIAFLDGKGYGTSTIESEVRNVRRFVSSGILFDVGANTGAYTRELLKQFGKSASKIYCFEPSEELVKAHLIFNDERVTVVNAALGRENAVGVLYGTEKTSGLNSLTRRRLDHFGLEMKKVQDVQIITLDAFAAKNGIHQVDLLKLDVEGHELSVLGGASTLLAQKRINCIQFEFGGCNIDTRTYFQDFWYLLAVTHKFEIYRMSPLGLIKVIKYRETDESFLTTNYIAKRAD